MNGIKLDITNQEIVEAGLGVASEKLKYEDLYEWVLKHERSIT